MQGIQTVRLNLLFNECGLDGTSGINCANNGPLMQGDGLASSPIVTQFGGGRGQQGPAGPQGPPGEQGPAGPPPTIDKDHRADEIRNIIDLWQIYHAHPSNELPPGIASVNYNVR